MAAIFDALPSRSVSYIDGARVHFGCSDTTFDVETRRVGARRHQVECPGCARQFEHESALRSRMALIAHERECGMMQAWLEVHEEPGARLDTSASVFV